MEPEQPTEEYNPKIPASASSFIGPDQGNFLINFMTLYNAFAANHIPLDAASGAGNHTIIQMPEQPAETQFQTNAGEISVYCKNVEGQTDQIFLRFQGNSQEYPLTNYQIYQINSTDPPTQFFTFLPGQIIVYFGQIAVNLVGNTSFPLNLKPAIATNIISMNFCCISPNGSHPPYVTLEEPDNNGIYQTINLFNSIIIQPPQGFPTALFYIIMANNIIIPEEE